jgi:hypothetical protein
MKRLIFIIVIAFVYFNASAQVKEKTYKVLAACGQCQLGMNSKTGCDLAIQLAGKTYWVDGTGISDHGDQHAPDGFCKTTRKAEVTGTINDDRIKVSSLVLIEKKKKKQKK